MYHQSKITHQIQNMLNLHTNAFKKNPLASDPDKLSQFGVYQIMMNDEISLISEQVYTPIPRGILHSEEGILQALSNLIENYGVIPCVHIYTYNSPCISQRGKNIKPCFKQIARFAKLHTSTEVRVFYSKLWKPLQSNKEFKNHMMKSESDTSENLEYYQIDLEIKDNAIKISKLEKIL